MDRVSRNKEKILIMVNPRMKNIMRKIKCDYNDNYFKLTEDEKDIVSFQIAVAVLNATLEILNYQFTKEEVPAILEISAINLTMLEHDFSELELYSYAQIMKDSKSKINNDLFELVGNKL